MKLYQLALMFLIALCLMIADARGATRIQDTTVSISTITATPIAALPGRKSIYVVNESATYNVRIASWSIDEAGVSSVSSSRGYPVTNSGGKFSEESFVTPSAWYLIIDSPTAPANTTAISATVTYRQKD